MLISKPKIPQEPKPIWSKIRPSIILNVTPDAALARSSKIETVDASTLQL